MVLNIESDYEYRPRSFWKLNKFYESEENIFHGEKRVSTWNCLHMERTLRIV